MAEPASVKPAIAEPAIMELKVEKDFDMESVSNSLVVTWLKYSLLDA